MDAATILALSALIIGVVGAVATPLMNRRKTRAQTKSITATTESIATRTTLEINEDLRTEIRDHRKRAREEIETRDRRIEQLEAQVKNRDERIDSLEARVAALRTDIDTLEAEIVALRRAGE